MMLFPTMNEKPPTLYSILNSIVNFDAEETTKIKDLAHIGRAKIFNFDYPLSDKLTKEEFETLILNKFIMRRIGFETFTAFQIALNVKLNEIMPIYNKMFDMLNGWDIFNDGEVTERKTENISQSTQTNNTTLGSTSSITNTNNNNATITFDKRHSELPQNEIDNVKDGNYMTDYSFDTETNSSEDTQIGTNKQNTDQNSVTNTDDNIKQMETIKKSPADKMRLYQEFIQNKNSIYTMIFKDIESLFYGLV